MTKIPPSRCGVLLVIAAMACFAMMDTAAKYVSTAVPVAVAIWVRFLIQAAVTGVVLLPSRGRAILKTRHPWLQILRGMLTAASSVLGLLSLQTLAVADFTAIIMLIPMVITVVSVTHLKEKVPGSGWLLLLGGLGGALLVILPGSNGFEWGMLLSLGAVVFNSGFQLLTSYLSKDDDPQAMHFYTGVVATAVFMLTLPFFWKMPTGLWVCALLLLMGLSNTVGQYFMILVAYARARPNLLTPYLYFQIAFATMTGWLVFSQTPDRLAALGIAIITLCGLASSQVSRTAVKEWLLARRSARSDDR